MPCFGRTQRAVAMDTEQPKPAEAMQPPPDGKLVGYLDKRGRRLPTWRHYWFVLDGPLLLYFRSEEDYKQLSPCKGSFNLGLVLSVRPSSSAPQLALTTRSQTIHIRAPDRSEQQRWLQGLLDSIQQFSRVAAPQAAGRRYEDACMPPAELTMSTAERVRRVGFQQAATEADKVLEVSRNLRSVQSVREPHKDTSSHNRAGEIAAKLPKNTTILRMLERQINTNEGKVDLITEDENENEEIIDDKESTKVKETTEKTTPKIDKVVPVYSQVNKTKSTIIVDSSNGKGKEEYTQQNKEEVKNSNKEEDNLANTNTKNMEIIAETENNKIQSSKNEDLGKLQEGAVENQAKTNNEDSEGDYEQIKMPEDEGDYDQIKEAKDGENSDGDYDLLQEEYQLDDDLYEQVDGAAASLKGEAFRATPVVVLGADEETDYAEASEVCLSMNWDDPQIPPRSGRPMEIRMDEKKHRTIISLLAPEVVIIDSDPPPRRPHSADELEALLGQQAQSPQEEFAPDGLFRATPVRLQRAQKAAHAWAQDLPDLVPAPQENKDVKDAVGLQEDEEESEEEEDEEEEEMSLEDAMNFIKASRQSARIATTKDGLHQAVAVKVSPCRPFEAPITAQPIKPLSFALTDVELTLEETVDTLRSPFTSLAID